MEEELLDKLTFPLKEKTKKIIKLKEDIDKFEIMNRYNINLIFK